MKSMHMSEALFQQFHEGLVVRGFAPSTVATYVRLVRKLPEHYLRSPDQITNDELSQYLLYLLREKKYARKTMIAEISALRMFYRIVLRRSTEYIDEILPRWKTESKLPQVYSKEEIRRLLSVQGLQVKQMAMLITAYAAGLRVSEVCHLKLADILSSRMQIRIEQGKNLKDRYTILSPKLLNVLRNYWRIYRPAFWLFPGPRNPDKPIEARCLERTFVKALKLARLPKRGNVHSLRHSFATHLYESGVTLTTLQSLLGHRWLASTMVYLHVSESCMAGVQSPFDSIDVAATSQSVSAVDQNSSS
jgi:integrase/recombinase XerD